MADITSTARGTNNILANRIVVDMRDTITLLQPRVSPLAVMLKRLRNDPASNVKFEWMEDALMSNWADCPAGVASTSTTSVVLATGQGSLVAINDLIKVVATGEVLRVTAVATDTLTVTRAYGETAAANIPASAKLLIIGNAMMQGSGASAEKYNQIAPNYNYTQIFKTPFSVTNTLEAVKLYGQKELSRLQVKKGIEHMKSIEYALLFGERKYDTGGAQPISTTRGITSFLKGTDNVQAIDTTDTKDLQLDAFEDYLEGLFTYGSDKKMLFCSASMLTWLNGLLRDKVRIIQSDSQKTLGMSFMEYQSAHGVLQFMQHPLLENGYTDTGIALDIADLAYRPLQGRDTKLKTNIQNNDEDGRRDMYITEAGLEFKQAKKHGLLTLTR